MNNSVHPTFTHIFRTEHFAASEEAKKDVRATAVAQFRGYLERIQGWLAEAPLPSIVLDAYAFTFLRWGGIAGIDPASLPRYRQYVEDVMRKPPVAAALERERIRLDTYKPA
jgi:glutathione S-transferase